MVEEMLGTSAISSVNWSEVIQKALEHKIPVKGLREELESLGLEILPFTAGLAEKTAGLREETRSFGLSLGDRACLALAGVVALGEMGDKTQLLAMMLAARFRRPWPIVLGILAADLGRPAVTTDRVWADLDLRVEVRVVR